MTNRPVSRLLASGAIDPDFSIPSNLLNLRIESWAALPDAEGRIPNATLSNGVLRVFRLSPRGEFDAHFAVFAHTNRGYRYGPAVLAGLDGEDRILLAGDALTNGYAGLVRLGWDGGVDPTYGPVPLPLGGTYGMATAPRGRVALMRRTPPVLLWVTADGRAIEGARSLPPLSSASATDRLAGFHFDSRERLYVAQQQTPDTAAVFRLTAQGEWDEGFGVRTRGGRVATALSPDGGWLYVAGATEVNGLRSGGLVRVSTLATPRLEVVDAASPTGVRLRLHGEPNRRHRLETTADLLTWQPFVEVTLGDEPTVVTDWTASADAVRFYRLGRLGA